MDEGNLTRFVVETLTVLWWSLVGVLAFYGGSWLFDKLDPIDYRMEIQKGNMAAAVKLSAVLLGLAAIIIAAIR
jgi:uncharacterized membrane protein YjfL (UPF0719 family)